MEYTNWPPKIKYGEVLEWYNITKDFLGGETLCDILVRYLSLKDLREILEDTLSRYPKEDFDEFLEYDWKTNYPDLLNRSFKDF